MYALGRSIFRSLHLPILRTFNAQKKRIEYKSWRRYVSSRLKSTRPFVRWTSSRRCFSKFSIGWRSAIRVWRRNTRYYYYAIAFSILFRRAIYNCKIVSHCFSFYTFQREKRKERLFSRTRTLLHGERFVLLSFCALYEREGRKGYWYVIGFPQLLKIEFSSFPERGTKTSIFLLFLDVRMTLTQFYSYSYY